MKKKKEKNFKNPLPGVFYFERKKEYNKYISKIMKKKKIIFICLVVFLSCVVAGSTYALYLVKTLPSPESFSPSQVSQSTKIFDREEKEVLYEIHGEEKRTVVPFEEIPKNVKNAVLAAEDSSFYTNPGFDIKGILRAVYANLKSGDKSQGGSTISQQLARNVFPISKEKNIYKKVKRAYSCGKTRINILKR
jgi:penicillin-binding protein 1A